MDAYRKQALQVTKEIIVNFTGALMKMISSPFEVGDW